MKTRVAVMAWIQRIALRVVSFFRANAAEADLAREINAHLQLLEDTYRAGGMSREEAYFAARRAFGGQLEQVKERQRDERSFRILESRFLLCGTSPTSSRPT